MITEKDHQVILFKENFRRMKHPSHFKMICVDKSNYTNFESDIKQVSNFLNNQLTDWNESPTYDDIVKRFNANSLCHLFYYNDSPIGWNWANDDVRFDWYTFDKSLPPNHCYAGGCFVTNLIDRPANAGIINYNMLFTDLIDRCGYDIVSGYCDWWNRNAVRVNRINGLLIQNWYFEKQ